MATKRKSVQRGKAAASNGSDGADGSVKAAVEVAEEQPFSPPPLPPEMYFNRELSWLAFNQRVLDEAADQTTPLLERVKFAAIFAANLDEFFMIRVANLKRKLKAGITDPGPDGRTPSVLAPVLKTTVQQMLDEHAALLRTDLLPALAAHGIQVVRMADLNPGEAAALSSYFEREIFPVLTPQAVDRARRFPHISNQSLNLIVVLRTPDTGSRYARIKIPAVLPRLVPVPNGRHDGELNGGPRRFVWLEDLVAAHLARLFPGNEVVASYPFHVNRDSDIDVDEDEEEARDLLRTMEKHLSQRTFGSVVMLLVDTSMPDDVRLWLMDQLHASERDLYVVDGPLALEGLVRTRPDRRAGAQGSAAEARAARARPGCRRGVRRTTTGGPMTSSGSFASMTSWFTIPTSRSVP